MDLFFRSCFVIVTRMLRWGGTGVLMGVYCGGQVGVVMGVLPLLLFFIVLLPSIFTLRALPTVSEIGGTVGIALLAVVALGIAGFAVGIILGGIIGFLIYSLTSLMEWRHPLHDWGVENERKLVLWTCKGSVVGALSLCTSVPLILVILRQTIDAELMTSLYYAGCLGGFAVSLFIGVRNIIRENAVSNTDTCCVE